MIKPMNLDEVLQYRRSVRVYDKMKPIDTEKVKHCLELATLHNALRIVLDGLA